MITYAINVLGGLSHLLNAILGGDARYSFSARTGAAKARGKAWAQITARLIDALLWSHNHCAERAHEEGLV